MAAKHKFNTTEAEDSPRFDLRHLNGPFDIIGDVHGCFDELLELLSLLGYEGDEAAGFSHPKGRMLVFLGDLGDRGPRNADAFALGMAMVEAGKALYTPGNHCNKLMRYLMGRHVQLTHGLDLTVLQVEERERKQRGFKRRLLDFIETAPPYLWLDGGSLVVAHAGIKERLIGRDDDRVRTMCLYGDITGRTNPDGTPVRLDWAQHYRGEAAIVYGHTPVPGPRWVNNTANIDQGCVFGGWLTGLRWPEREAVQVRARHAYYQVRTPEFLREIPI
jgi:protein phosphatase